MKIVAIFVATSLATALGPRVAASLDAFDVTEISATGRTVVAEMADLDGDGRTDLLEIRFEGMPPRERRTLRVRFQDASGELPADAQLHFPLPPGTAAYDLADVLAGGGTELLVLQRSGVRVLSFATRQPVGRDVPLPNGVTVGPDADERGLSRFALVNTDFGPEPVLLVPGFGEAFLLALDGRVRARIEIGERINYFVQPPGLIYAESDIQLFVDVPRFSVGDIDGDGRNDLLSSARHELRIFLQQPDGSLPAQASRRIPLERVSMEDHIRGSGAVRAAGRDIDGDGRMDLLLSVTSGGLANARSATSIHLNRNGNWNLDSSDFTLTREQAAVADQLIDVDGDGHMELLQGRIPLSVLELVELFLTRSFDTHVAVYRLEGSAVGSKNPKPVYERKLGLPMSLETSRLRGFIPSFDYDLNADGHRDFLHSTDGTAIEVYLGTPETPYQKLGARQKIDAEGVIRAGDLNSDGLTDFVLWNPRRPDAPIRLLINRGLLPGTRPSLRSADANE